MTQHRLDNPHLGPARFVPPHSSDREPVAEDEPTIKAADLMLAEAQIAVPSFIASQPDTDDATSVGQAALRANESTRTLDHLNGQTPGPNLPVPAPVPAPEPLQAIKRVRAGLLELDRELSYFNQLCPPLNSESARLAGVGVKGMDDLQAITGIGLKTSLTLKAAGIHTFADLAESNQSQLENILRTAGRDSHLSKPGLWIIQASHAAMNEWAELGELQRKLSPRKHR